MLRSFRFRQPSGRGFAGSAKQLNATLNLPATGLPLRGDPVQVEERHRGRTSDGLYRQQVLAEPGYERLRRLTRLDCYYS